LSFIVVIPARYDSTRLPGKPLRVIAGKTLIQHVYERAIQCGAARVIIATDDDRICKIAEEFNAPVCMTSPAHQSGTDRLAEVAVKENINDDQVVVNLQGDEPLMPVALVQQVAQNLADHSSAAVATLCMPITDSGELFDPHAVKVVMDAEGYAMYFSRAPVPWDRENFSIAPQALSQTITHYRHIGLYAYRGNFLKTYAEWPSCELEKAECLEQLRVLWNGQRIHVAQASEPVLPGVDTEADLERVRAIFER